MKNKKIMAILLLMIVIVIGIIVMILLLLMNVKKDKVYDDVEEMLYEDLEQVTNHTTFFRVNYCINQYVNYIKLGNQKAYMSINRAMKQPKEYSATAWFYSEDMYSIDKVSNITIFVKGYLRNGTIEEETYYIVNLDYNNNTFDLIESTKEEFESAMNNQINEMYKKDISISKNEYNAIEDKKITDLSILKIYFDDFKYKALNKPEEAFQRIDVKYRQTKFKNDVNEFKQYVQKNIMTLQEANIVKHEVNQLANANEYTCIDQYNHYYKFTVTGMNQYTVVLDNYTIQSTQTNQQYEGLTNEQKALSNMDKIMKLINEKDYGAVYGYLNTEFKNTNFPTIEVFTNYIQENFFENNIVGKIGIKTQGNLYLLNVPYKESLSTAAEEDEKTFIMKLGEGMNFEISFEI